MRTTALRAGMRLLAGALVVLLLDGPLYRFGILPLELAWVVLLAAMVLTAASALLLLLGLLSAGGEGRRAAGALPVVACVGALALTITYAVVLQRGFNAPPIHDITTNLQDPPDFADVVPLREAAGAKNPPEYLREAPGRDGATIDVPAAQREAYSDIGPERLAMPAGEAFAVAERAAREMGWDIVASVPAEGRIEATDTTAYFGFQDDVIVRVRTEAGLSRVDVRSKSRVGMNDRGRNAARIRDYLAELRDQTRG